MARRRWRIEDIPWRQARREQVVSSEELFYMVTTASLLESTTHLYARNLADHFAAEPELATWVMEGWLPEEHQHGRALREYTLTAWPHFDWEAAYAGFLDEFQRVCKGEALLPGLSRELVSRCVVEMGTASYYTALGRASPDPVLASVTHHIYEDEVGHYKQFYRHFLRLREVEGVTRPQVAGALWHRLMMLRDEDTYIALKHVRAVQFPGSAFGPRVHRDVVKRCRRLAARHFPHQMAVKMLLKPLDLRPAAQHGLESVVETVVRHAII
jgi:hypothetical protein